MTVRRTFSFYFAVNEDTRCIFLTFLDSFSPLSPACITVGCIPVVADGTKKLVGMVTRTDLLRQHKYYPSLHYHNKGYADSIAARKPIIELRRKLKQFDLESE